MQGASEKQPLVSVLTASYDSSEFIEETLESAMNQTYERLEVIVADDCSTDDTRAIVRGYAERHPGRVKLVEATSRAGPCRRRNDALAASEGPLVCWLDHDDLWMPTKVEKQVRVMLDSPEVGLVHTGFEAFDSDTGKLVPGHVMTEARSGDLLRDLWLEGTFIGAPTPMFRREALARTGGRLRDSDFAYGDDYYAWLVIALDWRIEGIDEVLARYRLHGGNLSFKQGNHYLKRIALLREFTGEFPEARERLGRWRRIGLGRHYLGAARFEAEQGHGARRLRYWLAGAIRAPGDALGTPARGLVRQVLGWGGRLARRLGLLRRVPDRAR